MESSPTLLTASTLALSLGLTATAQAQETIALSFDLEPIPTHESSETRPEPAHLAAIPLPIPPEATRPPLGNAASVPQTPYGGGDALALAPSSDHPAANLPAPPAAIPHLGVATSPVAAPELTTLEFSEPVDIAINFDLDDQGKSATAPIGALTSPSTDLQAEAGALAAAAEAALELSPLFAGGAESLVARAVGSAEGTRTPDGHRTPAYFGHVDPGNAAWNLGSFSYQHGANSPDEADQKQLRRLRSQAEQLQRKAAAHDVTLSEAALLNGIDLANQAPMAALDRWGYVERLAQAQQSGLSEEDAIVWARVRAFLDPDTQRWNAPGLGNTLNGISQDQTRRAKAIARALATHSAPAALVSKPTSSSSLVPDRQNAEPEEVDGMLTLDLPPLPTPSFDAVPGEPTLPTPLPQAPMTAQSSAKAAAKSSDPPALSASPAGAIPTTQVYQPQSEQGPIELEADSLSATSD
jgi:hypothetical protein